jgi:FAD-dependent oxidoreductase domain-containing protein 1
MLNHSASGFAIGSLVVKPTGSQQIAGAGIEGGGSVLQVSGEHYVNATGAWAQDTLGIMIRAAAQQCTQSVVKGSVADLITPIPVEARKRCIFVVDCQVPQSEVQNGILYPPRSTPLVIDPSGIWFRPEGQSPSCQQFIMGVSPVGVRDVACKSVRDLESIDYSLFEDEIWPTLAHRVPAFAYLKLKSAWAGFYEYNTLDQVGYV